MNLRTLSCALALATLALPAGARDYTAKGLTLTQPWSRATPPGAPTAAGFLDIASTRLDDRLVGGSTPIAAKLEIHEMSMTGGVMRMRPLAGGLTVPRGGTAHLAPSGLHLMFVGLKRPLKPGERFPATLRFQRAGEVRVEFEVRGIGEGASK